MFRPGRETVFNDPRPWGSYTAAEFIAAYTARDEEDQVREWVGGIYYVSFL